MEESILVAVGSTNPVKISPVRTVLARIGLLAQVQGISVPSGVADQPIGLEEIRRGAMTRATNARLALAAAWGIGMEGGVEFDSAGMAWLFSIVAIVTRDGRSSIARGGQLQLPPRIAARLLDGAELGPLMDEILGTSDLKHGPGAIGYLTTGLISREDAYRDCFCRALAPLLHPELYTGQSVPRSPRAQGHGPLV